MALRALAPALLLAAALAAPPQAAADEPRSLDAAPQLAAVAEEARQTIAVIDWFYVQHRACPQPSRPDELTELQSGLGDGFSVEKRGQFTLIRGISMNSPWLYYASEAYPDRCTLWRKLGWDPALIWRRRGGVGSWVYDPGDGSAERPLRFNR